MHGCLPEVIEVSPALTLRKWRVEDAPTYYAALNKSREFLVKTLPQRAVPATLEEAAAKVEMVVAQWETRESFQYFIWGSSNGKDTTVKRTEDGAMRSDGDNILGAISLFNRHGVGSLEVGFWIAESHIRQGIATRTSLALCLAAFEGLTFNTSSGSEGSEYEGKTSLHSLEIYHDTFVEEKSGGVARKLLFQRIEESKYDPGPGPICSGILVRWKLPVANYEDLKTMQKQQQ